MRINDLSHRFGEKNIVDLDQIAPFFYPRAEESVLLQGVKELIDEKMHRHVVGLQSLSHQEIANLGFELKRSSILAHEKMAGWLIKGNSSMIRSEHDAEHVLRVPMACKMRRVAEHYGLNIYIPEKRLIPARYPSVKGSLIEKYYLAVEEVVYLEQEAMVERMLGMRLEEVRVIASDIVKMIQYSGWQDVHSGNLVMTEGGKIAILDTEPWGMIRQERGLAWHASLRISAKGGLSNLCSGYTLSWPRRGEYRLGEKGRSERERKFKEVVRIFAEETKKVLKTL